LARAAEALSQPATASSRRPNIVYILADDLGYGDLGCYGQKIIRTPNIDRLAAEGMRFTQHYSGSTVCAPSRCCLMTGLHTGHARIRGNALVPLKGEDVTVASLLQKAGYRTACIGKWGLGEAGTTGHPNKQGFDHFFGYLNQGDAHYYYPPFLWRNDQKAPLEGNDKDKQTGQYSHDLMTAEALQFVRDSKDKPFFLYLAYTIPHLQLTVPEDSLNEYKGKFDETPVNDKHYGRCEYPRATRAAMITRMDRDIGTLMKLLKDLGLDDNTLVIFTSDNGPEPKAGADTKFFGSNGPWRGDKRDLYEGGIRVPMIARWPGQIKGGSESGHVSAFWDMLPTFCDVAGVESPNGVDGLSIAPTLLGAQRQRRHEYLYWEFFEQGGKQALRCGDWKAVRLNCAKAPDGPVELYNLATDPAEATDMADTRPYVAKRMMAILDAARQPCEHRTWNFGSPTTTAPAQT
jgi:arylsulfatase A-like enzyme